MATQIAPRPPAHASASSSVHCSSQVSKKSEQQVLASLLYSNTFLGQQSSFIHATRSSRLHARPRSPSCQLSTADHTVGRTSNVGISSPQNVMLDSSQPSSSDRDGLLADFWEEQRQLMTIAYGSVRSTFFIAVLAGLIGTLLARGLVSEKGVEVSGSPWHQDRCDKDKCPILQFPKLSRSRN